MSDGRYAERRPALAGLDALWTSRLSPTASPFLKRVLPDGCIDLIWMPGAGQIQVAGPDTGPHYAKVLPGDELAAVRFRPGMAPPALGVPADAVRNARIPLTELWGGAAERLAEMLATAPDPGRALERAVARRLRAAPPPDPAAAAIVAALDGLASVPAVAARLGVSERQLRRRCLAAFGYGPKTLQRILRFQRGLALARSGTPFADVAYSVGYADQAHLARDVRDLAGASLRELSG